MRANTTHIVASGAAAALALLAGGVAPASAAGTAYDTVIAASVARTSTLGGATYACQYHTTGRFDLTSETVRYSADASRVWIDDRARNTPPFIVGSTQQLLYFPVPSGGVNAADHAYQRHAATAAAAAAGKSGTPIWITGPQQVDDPSSSIWTADSLPSLLAGGLDMGTTPVPVQVDATHWVTSTAEITTSDGAVVGLDLGANSDGSFGRTATCIVAYGPAAVPAFTGLSISQNQRTRVSLPANLTTATTALTALRFDTARLVSRSRTRPSLTTVARRMLADARTRFGSAWASATIRFPAGAYRITLKNPTARSAITWQISRWNFHKRYAGRAEVSLYIGRLVVPSTSPLH